MAREVIPHQLTDWSDISDQSEVWSKIDYVHSENNFGIHRYEGRIWTSGFVGVGRVYDKNFRPIQSGGKEHIVVIKSRYGLNPWEMLEIVMADDEYPSYVEELETTGKFLFKVFYDQPVIRLAQDVRTDGNILYALSFINSCYRLCKNGLKKEMYYHEENYTSKIRGKVVVNKNIRENTSRGKNNRFYCKFIDFTEDNIENRILKATLKKCKKIIASRFEINDEVAKQILFCQNIFRHVRDVSIKLSDFNKTNVSGLYMYYNPLLKQARCIQGQKYFSYAAENGDTITQSVFTIPYMINMETLFEFYARAMIKKSLQDSVYRVTSYAKKLFLQKGVSKSEDSEKGIHLIPYSIPDIIISDDTTHKPVAVMDAKYKAHNRAVREDSHQLLSYVLLTDVDRCGFVFPNNITELKPMTSGDSFLNLSARRLRYYELLLGKTLGEKDIEDVLK